MDESSALVPIVIGKFAGSFGVHGWIKINSFTAPKDKILSFKSWLVKRNNNWDQFVWEHGKLHGETVLIKVPNCDSPEQAKELTNLSIGIWRQQLPTLSINEYYWHDLIGLEVRDKAEVSLGVIKDLIATGANDVLVVVNNQKERILIPYISQVILKIDLINKVIKVDWENSFL